MLLRLISVFFFCGSFFTTIAQPIQSKILQQLLRESQAVTHIHHNEFRSYFLDKIDPRYKKNHQYLLKTSNGLYLGVEGTGCIYKVIELAAGLIDIVRIDSTVYSGNNFCAANFVIDSSIYSFGGYGFWRTNGLLKTYNSFSKEWDVIPLSEEKPSLFCQTGSGVFWSDMDSTASNTRTYGTAFAPSMFWVDSPKKLFYEITQRQVNEAISDTSVNFYNQFTPAVNVLDMRTRQWKQLGYLIDYGWHHLMQTPWGLLVFGNSDNIYLADFASNTRLACKEEYLNAYRIFFMKDPPQVAFYSDGYIYMGAVEGNQFDSIPFSVSHFMPIEKPLYRDYKTSSFNFNLPELLISPWFLYPLGILVGIILGFVLLGVFRNNMQTSDGSWKTIFNSTVSTAERVNMLTQTEKSLIELISNSSFKGRKVSIEEVNKVIGVAGKNEPIKRRVRSEIINSINEKWMIISASREKLIDSVKSPEDKRAREYFISTEILASSVFTALLEQKD